MGTIGLLGEELVQTPHTKLAQEDIMQAPRVRSTAKRGLVVPFSSTFSLSVLRAFVFFLEMFPAVVEETATASAVPSPEM